MPNDVQVTCGGVTPAPPPDDFETPRSVVLSLDGPRANVRLRIDDMHSALRATVPPESLDLAEVAAYVHAADQAAPRPNGADSLGERWRRRFHVRVPVRQPDRWNAPAVCDALRAALGFLTEDEYRFEFVPQPRPGTVTQYIEFGGAPPGGPVDEVALYSAGLDSLAGAVDAAANRGKRALLVNHRSHEKWTALFNDSIAAMQRRFGPHAPLSLPVHANKAERLTKDDNQRSRMFLYASLGAVAARLVGLDSLRVYENGVVGLNLPILGQLVGVRASRTTHPLALDLLGRFLTELFGRPFALENPFLWSTKADIVRLIADAGHADLIGPSISCGHTISRSNEFTHCGACSQCLDRRFGVLAAGLAAHDPACHYETELMHGVRHRPVDRAMLVGFLDRARKVHAAADPVAFYAAYGEAVRALPPSLGRASEVARRVYNLYRRHSSEVLGVLAGVIADHAGGLARGGGPPPPLVAICVQPAPEVVEVPPAEPDYLFRCQGDFWAVRYAGGATTFVKHVEGMRVIHELLGRAGRDVWSLDLSGYGPDRRRLAAATGGVPLTDEKALRACRKELAALEAEIGEAVRAADEGRTEELHERRRKLRDYVRSATGLGGDIREILDDVERARKLVINNVTTALTAIHRHDVGLAAHLKSAVKLSVVCRYGPEDPPAWEL
jgi:hypothetical protein